METSQPHTDDPIGVTLASIGAGASAGGTVLVTSAVIIRLLQTGQSDQTNTLAGFVFTAGVLLGMATAIVIAFRSSRPIVDLWRRAVTGAIALFGAAILFIIAMPVELVAGMPGLAVFAVLLIVAFIKTNGIVKNALSS